jgi:hypothetical protein
MKPCGLALMVEFNPFASKDYKGVCDVMVLESIGCC